MNYAAIAILACFALCQAMTTTHKPHHSHEPNEQEVATFYYSHNTHNIIIKIARHGMISCYIGTLSDTEKANVHIDTGLRAIELKMFASLSAASATTVDMLKTADATYCKHNGRHPNATISYFLVN